jgi:heme iron utilization protein
MAERPTGHDVPSGDEGGTAADERPGAVLPPEPSHAERCRTLVASASRGALSTLAADPAGYPYGSVASFGLDDRGNPLFFVSLMAEHTQNAMRDPRGSLLVTEPVPDGADPLASGRVTLMGLLSTVADEDRPMARERYLAANPTSAYYIDFGDFTFYRLDVESIRYVGGYGRMSWVDAAAYADAEADPLAAAAAGIIEHMNADHAEAQVLFCRHLLDRPDTTEASMSAVDRYGFEMIAVSPAGRAAVRLGFPDECTTGDQVRQAMVALVAAARAAAPASGSPQGG